MLLITILLTQTICALAKNDDSTDVDELKQDLQTLTDNFRSLKTAVIVLGVVYGLMLLYMFIECLGLGLYIICHHYEREDPITRAVV